MLSIIECGIRQQSSQGNYIYAWTIVAELGIVWLLVMTKIEFWIKIVVA